MEEINKTQNKKHINWQDDNERILKTWSDKAMCYQMMHNRSHKRYWALNAWFSIPVIIFSTITGTANFAQDSVNDSWKNYLIFSIGTINIISGIITTISQFLGVAQKSEGHRLACVHWDKFSRKIKIELSKIRSDRLACNEFLDTCQQDYDRLIETSPDIPEDITRWFIRVVNNGSTDVQITGCTLCIYEFLCFPCGWECINTQNNVSDNENKYKNIELPEIVGSLKETIINMSSEKDDNNNEYAIYSDV